MDFGFCVIMLLIVAFALKSIPIVVLVAIVCFIAAGVFTGRGK